MKKVNIKVDKYPTIYHYTIVDTVWEMNIETPQRITIKSIYKKDDWTTVNITSIWRMPKLIGKGVYVEAKITKWSVPPHVWGSTKVVAALQQDNIMDSPLSFLTAFVSYMKNRARI